MRDFIKKVSVLFMILFLSVPLGLAGLFLARGASADEGAARQVGENTEIIQNGCYRKVKKTEKTQWTVPRKPIDLVILQDASGSFEKTIPSVKNALKRLTTYVKPEQYNETDPHLVSTGDPDTTDRVFVSAYQGLDQVRYFDNEDFTGAIDTYTNEGITGKHYQFSSSDLTSDQKSIHSFIDNITVGGGTPTVPGITDALAAYNSQKGEMKNGRKTVFLLVTDGVANGYRLPDGNVVMDKSYARTYKLQPAWGLGQNYFPEAAQDIVSRANELKEAGNTLKNAVGSEGSVVIGFWERVAGFTDPYFQYGSAYLNGFGKTLNIGDNRSVQGIFHDALQSMASPDKVVNGKNVSFYVNEQSDIDKFSNRILESVAAALIKEDIKGEFTVTPGYKVDAVRINGKTVVEKVTDPSKQIRGRINQEGDNVTIYVPDSV
ncbi:VWA domain-containing protein, partial [Streptococcus oralis]